MSDPGKSPPSPRFNAPTPEEFDALIGEAYEVLELIGSGGMGAVYKARQPRLDRHVAIKILPPIDDAEGLNHVERFKREAQAMAKVDHPNIVTVYDFGETKPWAEVGEPLLYFVMEYIDGTDLHQLIASKQLTAEHVIGWVPQICEALQYAHSRGIVHRDIKPANVMITREGRVKMADFGLAKIITGSNEVTALTLTDVAMGTPDYVAPESLEVGMVVDYRADLYSLGILIYQMLTGSIPRGSWEPPSEIVPGIDKRFDAVVDKAIKSDREKRYQQASEISRAVTAIATDEAKSSDDATGPRQLRTGPVKSTADSEKVDERLAEQRAKREAAAREESARAKKRNRVLAGAV